MSACTAADTDPPESVDPPAAADQRPFPEIDLHPELYGLGSIASKWPNAVVPVCWDDPTDHVDLHTPIATYLTDSWSKWSDLDFQFSASVNCSGTHVTVKFSSETDFRGNTDSLGYGNRTITLLPGPQANQLGRFQYEVIHEFGHALGFAHEMKRPEDWPNGCTAPAGDESQYSELDGGVALTQDYDRYSIMNYSGSGAGCNPVSWQGVLSDGDQDGVRNAYAANTVTQRYINLDFGVPSTWQSVASDFDHDGRTDYVRAGRTGHWSYTNNGDGTFTQRFHSYGVDLGADWPAFSGDFNGDGYADYIRVGATGAWIMLGNPFSTTGFIGPFSQTYPGLDYGTPSTNWPTITGDFNGDGKTDYARIGATGAFVYIANPSSSNGGFNAPLFQDYTLLGLNFGNPATNWQTITGDFNHDGRMDYARVGASGAWVFIANPARYDGFNPGGFSGYGFGINFGDPWNNWPAVAGDFNGDGSTDILRVGATGAYLFLATGTGSFSYAGNQAYSGLNFGAPATDWSTVAGDFNGDGKTDYARLGQTGSWVFLSNGTATFSYTFKKGYYDYGLGAQWGALVGKFTNNGHDSYFRLGDTKSILFTP